MMNEPLYIQKQAILTLRSLYVDGVLLYKGEFDTLASVFFQELYRFLDICYAKFFKMDMLSKTLFLCSEALLKGTGLSSVEGNPHVAMCFFNRHSSLYTDKQYQETIQSFPSPSLFIYTLPNIALGEVSIRNNFLGESCTFVAPEFDSTLCINYVNALMNLRKYKYVICGWFDFMDDREEAILYIVSNEKTDKLFNKKNLER
jgi:hypothetical protein